MRPQPGPPSECSQEAPPRRAPGALLPAWTRVLTRFRGEGTTRSIQSTFRTHPLLTRQDDAEAPTNKESWKNFNFIVSIFSSKYA